MSCRAVLLVVLCCIHAVSLLGQSFRVHLPADARPLQSGGERATSPGPLDGRLLLLLSNNFSAEPRTQINDSLRSQNVFGLTLDGAAPGSVVVVDDKATGYPHAHLSEVTPGTYNVQVVLNLYETFHMADGRTIKLAPDRGEGQKWNRAPGNLYSKPFKITIGANGKPTQDVDVALTEVMPAIAPIADSEFVRRIRIQSQPLSKFWGRPVFVSATVLVPAGFDQHPNARFPLMLFEDHFNDGFAEFRTTPPDPNLKPDYSDRFHLEGYNRIQQQEGYNFYKTWTAKDFPRFLVVKIQTANAFYDDSYAVDSANLGPYGEAIETELIPAVEKKFQGIGQGWARFVYGGSTGGWEAMAAQVFYPDHYNGAFIACPDPVDFHAYTNIDIYHDKNAYFTPGANIQMEQPAMRDYLGHMIITQRGVNQFEAALGDHGRSGEQYDIWQAVFSPVGADGYPAAIFDKQTGVIDPAVAKYWQDHYDLTAKLQREWPQLQPKLEGKLHVYVGSDDTYMLNNAVYLLQDFLDTAKPAAHAEVAYGPRAEHCWNGDPKLSNAYSRLHYSTMYLPKIMQRIQQTAPKGADLKSWRY
ncbi:hypothetical protein [Terriglobus roseus]|uniref:hypothetical protein n=1 Tax=Terriglobus roseus TaxID=392734 RepID=UPI001E32A15E|nr:hypothetical protein [Terriglobus roseus]